MESQALKNDKEIQDLMAQCYASTKVSAKVLFPERFWLPFSRLHDEIFKVLDDDSIQQAAIAAPRGMGKTTTSTIVHPAKRILFREKKFIVPISATATKAVMDGENLKRELMLNTTIKQLFGPMKSESFSKEQWITQNGIMVMPRGAGQQIRGILFGRDRPDLIIADDLEDPEAVRNEELRAKLKEWWYSDVCNSINRASKDWKIVVVGTILHEDSLLQNLLDDPDWYSVRLEICDDNLKSNWPDFMSDEAVAKLHASHRRRGQLDVFYREYRNIPVSTEDATFRQDYFKHYKETDDEFIKSKHNLTNIVLVDPAKTVKLHSAESAIVGIGIDRHSAKMYIRDVVSKKMYPDELYNEMFGMMARLKSHILGVEETSLNEFIKQPIVNEIRKRGLPMGEPTWLKARAKKEERIAQLVPYYRQGYVYHNESCCGGLESQLMAFPRSRLWDIMDATAYIIEMLDIIDYYFMPPETDDPEDEFRELYDECEGRKVNWRSN